MQEIISKIKDEVIKRSNEFESITTSIEECYERVLNRWKSINNTYTEEEYNKYANKKKGIFSWYKALNKFIINIDKLS